MENKPEMALLIKGEGVKDPWRLPFNSHEKMITLHHGTRSVQFNTETDEKENTSEWLLPPEIQHKLCLPVSKSEYAIKLMGSGNYLIGPLVGIFVNENKIKKLLAGEKDHVYRRFAQVLERYNGLAVFFSLKRILWHSGKVMGVVRDNRQSQEIWTDEILPIPNVIYDRCFGQTGRRDSRILREKCALQPDLIRIINALPKLGKLQIYQLCSQNPALNKYLPKWDVLTHENAGELLNEFDSAYIKPDLLYKGKGITKITRSAEGILLEQRRESENYSHLCTDVSEVVENLNPYLEEYGMMVVQEAIPLMRYRGRPFDFRLLLQKDLSGSWKQTGLVARITGKGSIISSPRSGGDVATYDEAMGSLGKSKRKEVARTMLKFAVQLAETIDAQIGSYVELGFDIGVDRKGRIWLIEVNGKPLKVSIDRLKNHAITVNAYERPLEYAVYLEGFGRR